MERVSTAALLAEYLLQTKDKSEANIAKGKEKISYYYTVLLSVANNYIVERTKYGKKKSGQRSYLLPPDYNKMKTVRFYDGAEYKPLTEIKSVDQWNELKSVTRSMTLPEYWFVMNEQGRLYLELDGIPDATDPVDNSIKSIELVYEGYQDRLLFPDDYATGTITINNGEGTIVGSGTTFTSAMAGRFILPTGAKYFYELKAFTDTTHMTMVNYFQEASITGSAFKIMELLRIPPEFSYTPVWAAIRDYWLPSNAKKSTDYEKLYARDYQSIQDRYKNKTKGGVTPGKSVNGSSSTIPRNYPNGLIG